MYPEVGMGVTYRVGQQTYAGTVAHVEGCRFWFQQDRPLVKSPHIRTAYLFVREPTCELLEAHALSDHTWVTVRWQTRVELGVRRWETTPASPVPR